MYDEIIAKYSAQFNVPIVWIAGVIQTESSGNPNAYRAEPQIHNASYGLMQLLYSTAKGLGYTGTPEGLYDPDINIMLGTKLLGQLRGRFGDDVQAVYSAYNSGSGTSYLTNSSTAVHVANFMRNLETVIASNPVVVSTGSFGAILALFIVWYWKNKRK